MMLLPAASGGPVLAAVPSLLLLLLLLLLPTVVQPRDLLPSDVYLGDKAFSDDEAANVGVLTAWLDDIFWSELWDDAESRRQVYGQIEQLGALCQDHLPVQLSFAVAQALYSYFWFLDNGPGLNLEAALQAIEMYELTLNSSGCADLTLGVGAFIGKACSERWFYVIMLNAEIGTEVALNRGDAALSARLLRRGQDAFERLMPYDYFSYRPWRSIYDINTNANVFDPVVRQQPVWPNEAIPLAGWLEENYHVFKADLDHILANDLFDALYFAGSVSMTQFSPRRESWAPLSLISNGVTAVHACEVANRSCELLKTRPEIARCSAKDVGATFARLKPGYGIKPHIWTAPPRLGVHLGLHVPPGAHMMVGNRRVVWEEGKAVVFDDTYIHSVKHIGKEARYLLVGWFCHPCDGYHAEVPASDPLGLCPPW